LTPGTLHLIAAVEGGGDLGDKLSILSFCLEIPAAALDQLLFQQVFQCRCGPSIAPFSWATPRLLRVPVIPR
jgi:hypothetical protein